MTRVKGVAFLLIGTVALGAGAASAQKAPRPARGRQAKPDKGPLAGLPGRPGPALEKVKALRDAGWVNLGSPAPDPQWGKALGRSWSSKMPFAPDLQGAFLNGTGVHAAMTADGRYTDDIWFFDLNAHRWICIYPGTDSKTFVEKIKKGDLKVNDDGQLVDKDGQPVPYAATPGHSYQSHTYDWDRHQYAIGWGHAGLGGDQYTGQMAWHKEGMPLLQQQMKGKADRVAGTPFFFDTATGKFERPPSDGSRLQGGGTGGVFTYLPSKKSLWLYSRGDTQMADTASRRWVNVNAKGPTPKGIDFGACFDSKRDRVYVAGGSYREAWGKDEGYVYTYDVRSNTWTNAPNRGRPPGNFASNYACMHYDTVSDRVIVLLYGAEKALRGVYAYDPDRAEWGDAPGPLPAGFMESRECGHGFYAPDVNAHFFFTAPDSSDRGTVWAYRHTSGKP